jgi:hypothetical protein
MNCKRNWMPPLLAAMISLAGCASTRPVPVIAPCPALPVPPPELLQPPQSPAAIAELLRQLPP